MDQVGRYQITRELGRGAMGVVYLAVDPTIGRQVAIKTIRLGELDDADDRAKLRERLFREARSAGILSHPGIVTIYDMEEQGDVAFIAMEFVDGPTLDQLLSAREPIAPERMMSILRQTGAALDYAHHKSIVHRDIKPANIMIASDGSVKITDFGIAKVTTSQQYTQTGTIVGTPNYMSPEQVQGLAVTGRADQFSLSVICYEMLTGERPFTGEHLTTVVYKIVAEDPPPVQRLNPTLGPQIDAVLRRGLAKKPDARYGSCIDLINALDAACANTKGWKNAPRGMSLSLPTVAGGAQTAAVEKTVVATTGDTIRERRSASKVLPFVAALVVALGLIGLIAVQFGPGRESRIAETQPPAPSAPPAAEPQPSASTATPAPPPAAEEKKPSPMEPLPGPPANAPDAKKQQVDASQKASEEESAPPAVKTRPAHGPQDVLIMSEPPGATTVLDNNAAVSCKTPCILSAMPGRHTLSVNQDGYQHESRDFRIIDSPIELPVINLRARSGSLMLNSTPAGASIFVNDRPLPQSTPAQLSLPPGTYTVRVEKNGLKKAESVEIRDGDTIYRNLKLE
jgi:tRNA A-37 threonylcarbamoyl transferase component Bud32